MERLFYSEDKTGALCADDYKGINNQFVDQGKVIAVEFVQRTSIRSVAKVRENRTTTGFRWNYGGVLKVS